MSCFEIPTFLLRIVGKELVIRLFGRDISRRMRHILCVLLFYRIQDINAHAQMFGCSWFKINQQISIRFGSGFFKVSPQVLRIVGIHLSSQVHDLLSVHGVIKQNQVVTISSLGGIFVIVQILIVMTDIFLW